MVLCHGMTSRVALVMAPLLPRIRTGVGNMGLENGGGVQGGGLEYLVKHFAVRPVSSLTSSILVLNGLKPNRSG